MAQTGKRREVDGWRDRQDLGLWGGRAGEVKGDTWPWEQEVPRGLLGVAGLWSSVWSMLGSECHETPRAGAGLGIFAVQV